MPLAKLRGRGTDLLLTPPMPRRYQRSSYPTGVRATRPVQEEVQGTSWCRHEASAGRGAGYKDDAGGGARYEDGAGTRLVLEEVQSTRMMLEEVVK